MAGSRYGNQVETQSVAFYDRGGAVLAVDSDALAIQHIAGVLYQVDQFGNLTPLIGGGSGGLTAITGDVVATGPGTVNSTIQPGVVSYAKIQNVGANVIMGNSTGAPASMAELSPSTVRTMLALATVATSGSASDLSAGTLATARLPAFTGGDVTSSAGSAVLTIAAGAVTLAKMANLADQRIIGNVSGGAAAPAALTKANVWTFLGATGVAAGSYTNTSLTVTADGVITAIATGAGPGGGITELTGDVTAGPGSGSFAATLATVNGNVGTFTNATITVNAKGLITAASTGAGGGGAPTTATYITQTPDASLSNEQALSLLATGILKSTTTTGVLSIATAGTDYQSPLTFSTGLTLATSTVTSDLSTGKGTGQTAFGGVNTTNNLTLRPNAADSTTGRIVVSGLGIQVPAGSDTVPSIHFGTTTTGLYGTSDTVLVTTGGTLRALVNSFGVSAYSNLVNTGFYLGSAGTRGVVNDTANSGVRILVNSSARMDINTNGYALFHNVPFVSFTSSGTARAQAAGEVMAFAAVPPSQVAAAGSVLNAYRWDAVTATFTTGVNITTAAGVNLITVEAPTYTNASGMTVTSGATFTIKGAPVAGGSLAITNPYAIWIQGGTSRFDGSVSVTSTLYSRGSTLNLQANVGGTGGAIFLDATDIDVQGTVLPTATNTYNLGSSGAAWLSGFVSTVNAVTVQGFGGGGQLYLSNDSSSDSYIALTNTAGVVLSEIEVGGDLIPHHIFNSIGRANQNWGSLYINAIQVNSSITALSTAFSIEDVSSIKGPAAGLSIAGAGGAAVISVDDDVLGFFAVTPAARVTGGAATATLTWDATSATMLNVVYNMARTYGLLT
jgi:hypothetical protein